MVRLTSASPPTTVDMLGFPFHKVTEEEAVEHVLAQVASGKGGWVLTPNLDIVRMMSASPKLWHFLRRADLMVADGMPIVWASRLLGDPLPERVAGSSLISTLSKGAARDGRSVYLLGGDPGTADAAAAELRRRYPTLSIAGTSCPPRQFETDPVQVSDLKRAIREAQPDIVYVALGCPKQEYLIERLRADAPQAWFVGVGISFSYLCGAVHRAPAWMRRTGLEWAFRLAQEPGRLARRYLRDDLPFALRLFGLCLRARLRGVPRAASRAPALVPRRGRDP